MDDNSENQFSKYILGNYMCKCQTFINTYTIVWYRLSNILKYKPNCPYNSKQLTFLVKAVRERVRSIILSPPHIHISAYVRTILKEIPISLNIYSRIMCTISISLFLNKKEHVDLCVMRNAAQNIGILRRLMRTIIQIKSFCRKCYTICVVNV